MKAAPVSLRSSNGSWPWLAALAGFAVAVALFLRQDLSTVATMLRRAGPAVLLVVPYRFVPLAFDAVSWRVLLAPYDRARRAGTAFLLWAACVREGVARLLPLSSVGGELVGLRLPLLRGVDSAPVTASVAMQVVVSMINQLLFAALGLSLLAHLNGELPLGHAIVYGLAPAASLPLVLTWALGRGRVFARTESLLRRFIGPHLPGFDGVAVDQVLRDMLQRPGRILASVGWEFTGLVAGAVEVKIALILLGVQSDMGRAVALEAGNQLLRHLFFFVPGALGVQEAALLCFGGWLGIPADAAMALSLIKRLREVLFGLPALASWQWVEMRRWRRR